MSWSGVQCPDCRPEAVTKLLMDETPAPVLDPKAGKTKTGYVWALVRDDRPWGGAAPPGMAFTYVPGRGGQYADDILQDFTGILGRHCPSEAVRR